MKAAIKAGKVYPHVATLLERYSNPHQQVLEIGCGGAQYREHIKGHYLGLDLPRLHYDGVGPQLVADGQHAPLADNRFDLVFMVAVLSVIPDPSKALKECYRLLRPGGTLLIFDYNWLATRRLAKLNSASGHSTQVWSPWQLAAKIKSIGFRAKVAWDYVRGASRFLLVLQRLKAVRYLRFWIWQLREDWSVVIATKPEWPDE